MRKKVLPDGHLEVVLFDDFVYYQLQRNFPVQSTEQRHRNLLYLVTNVHVCHTVDPSITFKAIIDRLKSKGDEAVYFEYETKKDFLGRNVLKHLGVPVKFLKPYAETKDN